MKTMTYGTIPSFEEFEEAWLASGCAQRYEITLPIGGSDHEECIAAGLIAFADMTHESNGRLYLYFRPLDLHALVTELVEGGIKGDSDGYAEWAGNFASSIMTTLGFEWV